MSELTAIILAAGKGERLMPLTSTRPKALVEVAGSNLLKRATAGLGMAGVSDIVAVVGHCAQTMNGMGLKLLDNPRFADANNIYSLWVARDIVKQGCYIVNSDVIFDPAIAQRLVDVEGSAIITDDSISIDEEAMKAVTEGEQLVRLSKHAPLEDNHGEYIGLARIDPDDGETMAEILDGFIDRDEVHVYYENAIEELAGQVRVGVESVAGLAWAEIDDFSDLDYAEGEIAGRIDGARSTRD